MPDKPLDRRIQKTLQFLQNALVELISEKDYDSITIQEILDRANVGRSTFYAHFENKDQLLRSILVMLNQRYEEGIRQISGQHTTFEDNAHQMPLRILQFVEANQQLFRIMLGKPGQGNPLYDYLYAATREHIWMMIQPRHTDARLLEMTARYYASAFIGALVWWLENDLAYSAEEFAQMLNKLVLPGLNEILKS